MQAITVFFTPHPPLALHAIGGGNERRIQKTIDGYNTIGEQIKAIAPETIIYITPHGNAFRNALVLLDTGEASGDFGMFGYGQIRASKTIDLSMTESIHGSFIQNGFASVLLSHETAERYGVHVFLDHGVMVPMHFVDTHYSTYKIVHITSSFQGPAVHYKAGAIIAELLANRSERIVVVASGDLSHALVEDGPYNYNAFGPVFDQMVKDAIEGRDIEPLLKLTESQIESAAQCGLGSFCMAFGMMKDKDYESEVFSYEGPFGVGYLTGCLKSSL